MKIVSKKLLVLVVLIAFLAITFAGCTAIDEITKLKKKGFQETKIKHSSDYETWTIEMLKKDETGSATGELTIVKCKTIEAAKTYYDFYKNDYKNKKNGKMMVRKGKKIYFGTEDAVYEATK